MVSCRPRSQCLWVLCFLSLAPVVIHAALLPSNGSIEKLQEEFNFHPRYWKLLEMTMKYVKCLDGKELRLPTLDEASLIMKPGSCYTDLPCDRCKKEATVDKTSIPFSGFQPADDAPKPQFHCNSHLGIPLHGNDGKDHKFLTHFRMEYQTRNHWPPQGISKDEIPRMFLVETEVNGKWVGLSNQTFWLFPMETINGNSYRIRVTAVSPRYVYTPQVSDPVTLYVPDPFPLTVSHKRPPPQDVRVVETKVHWEPARPYPTILLRWKSGSGLNASCDFDVHYMDEDAYNTERRKADDAFWVLLEKLQFERTYEVNVMEKFGVDEESDKAILAVSVPSCLELENYNLDRCPPPPATNIKVENETSNSFAISWENSKAAIMNQTFVYIITVDKILDSDIPFQSAIPIFKGSVPSTQTEVDIKNVTEKGHIRIVILATNKKGKSREAIKIHRLMGKVTGDGATWVRRLEKAWMVIAIVVLGVMIILLSMYLKSFRKKLHRNREQKKKWKKWEEEEMSTQQVDRYSSKWEIDFSNLILHDVVGRGQFGEVRKATLIRPGGKTTVAVKTLRVRPDTTAEEDGDEDGVSPKDIIEKFFWEEFEILKGIEPHMHVVNLVGIVSGKPYRALICEYCDGGDLQTHLRKAAPTRSDRKRSPCPSRMGSTVQLQANAEVRVKLSMVMNEAYFMKDEPEYSLSPLDLLSYARQIACGMEFLSSNKIIHRDLAARNILISGRNRILKIADFGLSRDVYEQNWYKKRSNGKIPIKWLAIECLMKEVYTTKSDVWSFGILLWEIVTLGATPYPGIDNIKIYDILKAGYRMSKPDNCSDELYDLMSRCWNENPCARPDFTSVRRRIEELITSTDEVNYLNLDSTGTIQYSELMDTTSQSNLNAR